MQDFQQDEELEGYDWPFSEDQPLVSVGKVMSISSAHQLPEHDGKCKNLHGHNYTVEIELIGYVQKSGSSNGMVVDYGKIKEIVNKYDHKNLNDLFPKRYHPTTAENFAILLRDKFRTIPNIMSGSIIVRETDSTFAKVNI